MIIREIGNIINAKVRCGKEFLDEDISFAFASDLMSDVLTLNSESMLLITGLANVQSIRTAEMSDIRCIIYVRGKKVSPEMIAIAEENEMVLLECEYSMFRTCGLIYKTGVKPVF